MAVCSILDRKKDEHHGGDCLFCGYLEDYLDLPDTDCADPERQAFREIASRDPAVKIIAGSHGTVSRNAVSNQIIRYKDIFKLVGDPLFYPLSPLWRKERKGTCHAGASG